MRLQQALHRRYGSRVVYFIKISPLPLRLDQGNGKTRPGKLQIHPPSTPSPVFPSRATPGPAWTLWKTEQGLGLRMRPKSCGSKVWELQSLGTPRSRHRLRLGAEGGRTGQVWDGQGVLGESGAGQEHRGWRDGWMKARGRRESRWHEACARSPAALRAQREFRARLKPLEQKAAPNGRWQSCGLVLEHQTSLG